MIAAEVRAALPVCGHESPSGVEIQFKEMPRIQSARSVGAREGGNGPETTRRAVVALRVWALGRMGCEAERGRLPQDFAQQGRAWTLELCEKDSDGDGFTNGEELGAPCCVWHQARCSGR